MAAATQTRPSALTVEMGLRSASTGVPGPPLMVVVDLTTSRSCAGDPAPHLTGSSFLFTVFGTRFSRYKSKESYGSRSLPPQHIPNTHLENWGMWCR